MGRDALAIFTVSLGVVVAGGIAVTLLALYLEAWPWGMMEAFLLLAFFMAGCVLVRSLIRRLPR